MLLKNRFVKILSVSLPLLTRESFLSDVMINYAENYTSHRGEGKNKRISNKKRTKKSHNLTAVFPG